MRALTISLLLLATACGGDPVDARGDYSISLTNRDNGCTFMNWEEGNTAMNIPVTITQSEEDSSMATAAVGGLTGGFLDLAFGSHTYTGTVSGSSLDLTLFGTRAQTSGNCSYTYNSIISASLDGDVLTGQIRYESATNGNPDCSAVEGCVSLQDFNGTRPPTQ